MSQANIHSHDLHALLEGFVPDRGLARGGGAAFATAVTWLLVPLFAVESAVGLFVDGVYHEDTWAVAALRGNDLVTLVVVVPMLAAAVYLSRRSARWLAVWFGLLLYGVYNFGYYAFGTSFNNIFLLHEASFAFSLVALIGLASSLDLHGFNAQVRDGAPRRTVAAFMCFVGAALVIAWGGFSLRYAFTGEVQESVMPPTAVHLVYAMDMALLAPMFLGGGILLWRRAAWGHLLAIAVNTFGAIYLVVLEFVGGFQADAGIEKATWVSLPSIGGAVLCAVAAVALLFFVRRPTGVRGHPTKVEIEVEIE